MEIHLEKNTAKSNIQKHRLDKGMFLAFIDNPSQNTDTIANELKLNYVQFYFCTKGMITFSFNEGNYKIPLEVDSSFLLYNPAANLPLNLILNEESKLCIVAISVKKLHELLSENSSEIEFLTPDQSTKHYKKLAFGSQTKMVISQMENQTPNNNLKHLYLTAKVFELLTLYFTQTEEEKEKCPYLDNQEDARKIKQAKDFVLNHLFEPPSLKKLAKEIQLSEYKLKNGFKKVYGTTVYGFILDKKMEMGREYLEEKNLQVKDIAFKLGYENPSHFITAFKKKFGITPKQYTKEVSQPTIFQNRQ